MRKPSWFLVTVLWISAMTSTSCSSKSPREKLTTSPKGDAGEHEDAMPPVVSVCQDDLLQGAANARIAWTGSEWCVFFHAGSGECPAYVS